MNMLNRRLAGATVALATAFALVPAGAAHAEATRVVDGADATGSPGDILTVKARHGADQVRIKVSFADLRRHSDSALGAAVFIDVNRSRRGPEYALVTGLEYGTDYQLARVRRWKFVGEPLNCDHKVRLDYGRDVMKFRAARSCFANPTKVRVGVRMDDHTDGSHPITDWMIGRREFTPWLASA